MGTQHITIHKTTHHDRWHTQRHSSSTTHARTYIYICIHKWRIRTQSQMPSTHQSSQCRWSAPLYYWVPSASPSSRQRGPTGASGSAPPLMRVAWRDPPMMSACEMPSMARVTGEGPALDPRP